MKNPHELMKFSPINLKKRYTGIYFLFQKNDIIYIGKSINIIRRMSQGINHPKYTHFSFIECSKTKLDPMEAYYIFKYAPKYNSNYNYNKRRQLSAIC